MKFAKIMVMIVIFVFAVSVSCAADTNNASISEDNSQMLLSLKNEITDDTSENSILAQTNNVETLSAQKDSEILRANEGNYSDLRDDIFNNGGILTKSYYRYQPGDGDTIVINSGGFTVNGNGAVIDMSGSSIRAFEVTGYGVTFKNLTIKNANSNSNGGAIYFSESGTVENCNFTGNTATGDGGAVYFVNNGNVRNCNFTGNTADGDGGAVYFAYSTNPSTVRNCNFTANNATWGGAVYFVNNGNVSNCNFTGNTATGAYSYGGAVYFGSTGNVTNCNFTGNTATGFNSWGGAVYFGGNGNVANCNFTGNTATGFNSWGGAVHFVGNGNVTNCNFTGNNATSDGGAIMMGSGTVSNCNFTGNTATGSNSWGGAVHFVGNGNVTNCNFTGNNATTGSAIYFYSTSAQKSVSNSTFLNNRANAKDLQVTKNENNITITFTGNNNILNAIYSRNDAEVSFSNVTYWGANGILNTDTYLPSISNNAAGQNITVKGVVNGNIINTTKVTDENGEIVLDDAGDYWIIVSHKGDSYYTEVAETLFTNMSYNVNITSQTTNNKTVNITAKSNIFNEVMPGKLLFILPNSTQINANYTVNGAWWAVHEFDDAGDYDINASYIGLDGVIINNATISIRYDASVDVNNKTLDLFVDNTFTIVANTTPKGLKVTYKPDNSGIISVDNNGVVKALKEGNTTIIVSVGDNKVYAENTTTVTVTVRKIPTEIIIANETLNIKVNDKVDSGAGLNPFEAGNLTYTISETSIIKLLDNQIIALSEGSATITYSFAGNDKYTAAQNKTITVKVGLNDASVSVNNNTLNLFVDDTFTIVATTVPRGLNVTYMPDNSGIISVDENGLVTALKEGTAPIIVKVGGDGVYAENTTIVTVNVKKVNPSMDVGAEDITEGENATINVELPIDATGNVTTTVNGKTYFSPVDNGKAIIIIPGLEYGSYTLPLTYSGDDKYNSLTKDVNLTVKEDKIVVSAPDLTKYYSGNERFNVNVFYANGRAIAGKEVKITINGVTYKRTTDENGSAGLNINLNSGEYPVVVAVDDVKVNSTVFVKATIDASDVVKVFRNDTQYYARFVDVNGTRVANTVISFNVNGVIYNRATDDNGTAKLNINLPSGEYILTATNTVTGEKISNVIKVLSVIESGDLTKYFRNASQFIVRIHTADGGYVGAGEEVRFNINGMIYAKKTNATGHAKININLPQGLFTITTYYKDFSQGNSIEVLPILSAEDLSMKFMDGSQFKAQLVDGKGKPYPKQDVRFNINGVFYNKATGSDGVAKLNIRLLSGQYIITSSYNGCNIANKVTIKS